MKPLPLALFLLLAFKANSTTITWDGGAGNGLWSSATNWSPDQVPTASDDVVIANASVTLDLANITIQSLTLPQSYTVGDNRLLGASNLTINGNFELGNGTVDAGIILDIGQNLNWISGHLNGTSTVSIAGSLNFIPSCCSWFDSDRYTTRGFEAPAGSAPSPNVFGGQTRLDAPGFITINGSFSVNRDFQISLYGPGGNFTSNGTLTIAPGKSFGFSGLLFSNNGTCDLGTGSFLIAEQYLTNSGTVNMGLNSTFRGRLGLDNSGALNGSGTVITNVSFTQAGTISPGFSPGLLNFNSLPSGTTNTYIELQGTATPGTDYDQIAVAGAGVADGVLNLSFLGGFNPSAGDEFTIMTCNPCSGTFASISSPSVAPNTWELDMSNPNEVVLRLNAPLPIELVEFKATNKDDNSNLLTWHTASEQDNAGFHIERTHDAHLDWQDIGFVPGSGTSTAPQHYDFLDKNPKTGANYYRLRQMDFDGRSTFSSIVAVGLEGEGTLRLFPSPVISSLKIKGIAQSVAVAKVVDMMGRLLFEQPLNDDDTLDVSALPPGVYCLILGDNGKILTGRFVRQ
jgi:hypothetical protein